MMDHSTKVATEYSEAGERRAGILQGMKRWQAPLEKFVFPIILLLWPLAAANQGVSVMDTTYSLANYTYPEGMGSMWLFATFLANVAGRALSLLPFGGTMLGMNLFTGLIVSVTALVSYYILKRMIAGWMVFLGEFIAIALCWCPTVILYNYLTYLFLTLGVLFLFLAVSGVPEQKKWYLLAGISLGLNTAVKVSNAEYCALILALWCWCAVTKKSFGGYLRRTFFCVLGYLIGFAVPVAGSMIVYGQAAYFSMIPELLGTTGSVASYTPGGMLLSILSAYGHSLRWFLILIPCTLMGAVWFRIPLWRDLPWVKRLVYLAGIAIVVRFYYSRGMFTTNYQDYWSMFEWGMQLLILAFIFLLFGLAQPFFLQSGGGPDEQFLSAAVLTELLILPLGSNNYTFPILNCLFLIAPYVIWMFRRLWQETRHRRAHFAWHAMVVMILVMVLVQGSLFHVSFAFRDGTDGEKRSVPLSVENNRRAAGMFTTPENAAALTELTALLQERGITDSGRRAIVFGNAPGIHYLCSLPPAIDSTWPDLDSYGTDQFHAALAAIDAENEETRPVILIHHEETAQSASAGEKLEILTTFMTEHHYRSTGSAGEYELYE